MGIAQIGKAPDVPQSDGIADTDQQEIQLLPPPLSFGCGLRIEGFDREVFTATAAADGIVHSASRHHLVVTLGNNLKKRYHPRIRKRK